MPRGPSGPLASSPEGSPDWHLADPHAEGREDFSAVGISIVAHHRLQLDAALAELRAGSEQASEWGTFWGTSSQIEDVSIYFYDVFDLYSIPVEGTCRTSGGVRRRKPVSPAEHPQQAIARHAQDHRLACRNGDGQRPGAASCPPGRGLELATRDLHDRSRLAARPARPAP